MQEIKAEADWPKRKMGVYRGPKSSVEYSMLALSQRTPILSFEERI